MNRYTIRGAITVKNNNSEDIRRNTIRLLEEAMKENHLEVGDVETIIFTCTKDLDAVYPAKFAREIGFTEASLLCMQEMNVKDSLKKCIRILIFLRNNVKLKDVCNIYLNEAKALRKDIN
ncbi:MAG: chorismate mutase [Eubacteriales bacterium]